MADSWEDEADDIAATTTAQVPGILAGQMTDKWEGEDEDEVPDAWDAEEEEKPAASAASKEPKKTEAKTKSQKKSKLLAAAVEKKEKEAEEKRRQGGDDVQLDGGVAKEQAANLTPEELRRIQEEADLLVAKDTFGVDDAVPAHAIDPQKSIDLIQPVTKDDYDRLGRMISQKLRQFETNPHYPGFVESTFRECSLELDSEHLRKLSTMFSALATEKQKLQKAATKGGKKKGKGVVKVERDAASGAMGGEDFYDDEYDDFI